MHLDSNFERMPKLEYECANWSQIIPLFLSHSDILRALPQSMSVKKEIKSKVNQTIENKTKELGETKWSKFKYLSGVWYTSTRVFSRNILIDFELWYGPMKEIEGHFGGGVGTYFKFLRYLFILNMILMILSFGYVFCFIFDQFKLFSPRSIIVYVNLDLLSCPNFSTTIWSMMQKKGDRTLLLSITRCLM